MSNLASSKQAASPRRGAGKVSVGGTDNVAAFEAFLRGRALYEAGLSVQTDREALANFDEAIALDPNYAAAHARRARALAVIANQSSDASLIRTGRQNAIEAARKSVELAPTFADGYSALGFVLFTTGLDARSAKPAFDKSLQFGAGDGDVLTGFAMFCGRTGRKDEAEANIERAMVLDPLNPTVFRCVAQIKAMARDHRSAIGLYQRALTMNPEASVTHALLGVSHLFLNQLIEARTAFEKEPNKMFALPGKAIIDHMQGQKEKAQTELMTLIRDFGDSALYQQAQIYARWGDTEKALSTLERAYIVGDSGLAALFTDPHFDNIVGQTRFSQLLKSIGFE